MEKKYNVKWSCQQCGKEVITQESSDEDVTPKCECGNEGIENMELIGTERIVPLNFSREDN